VASASTLLHARLTRQRKPGTQARSRQHSYVCHKTREHGVGTVAPQCPRISHGQALLWAKPLVAMNHSAVPHKQVSWFKDRLHSGCFQFTTKHATFCELHKVPTCLRVRSTNFCEAMVGTRHNHCRSTQCISGVQVQYTLVCMKPWFDAIILIQMKPTTICAPISFCFAKKDVPLYSATIERSYEVSELARLRTFSIGMHFPNQAPTVAKDCRTRGSILKYHMNEDCPIE